MNLPPIPDTVKNEAAQSAVRLLDEIEPKTETMTPRDIKRSLYFKWKCKYSQTKCQYDTTLKPYLKLKYLTIEQGASLEYYILMALERMVKFHLIKEFELNFYL
jgi:hypothetical protein